MDIKKEIETVKYHIPMIDSIITTNDVDKNLTNYMIENGYKTYGFITAYNKLGIKDRHENNITNTKRLESDIQYYDYLNCMTEYNDKIDEKGFMIFDISEKSMEELQNKYKQTAILYGFVESLPYLIYIS